MLEIGDGQEFGIWNRRARKLIDSCLSNVNLSSFYDNLLLIYRLSDAGGRMEFTEVASGKDINKSLFCSDDGIHSCFIRIP